MPAETVIEDDRWAASDLTEAVDKVFAQICAHFSIDPEVYECCVMGCDDARIQELNAEFRDKGQPTNVLSWPSEERGAEEDGEDPQPLDPDGDAELGDIAISYDTCLREANDAGIAFGDHVTHLVLHGILHLMGYDHVRDQDATLMESIEVDILGKMGIADPYCR